MLKLISKTVTGSEIKPFHQKSRLHPSVLPFEKYGSHFQAHLIQTPDGSDFWLLVPFLWIRSTRNSSSGYIRKMGPFLLGVQYEPLAGDNYLEDLNYLAVLLALKICDDLSMCSLQVLTYFAPGTRIDINGPDPENFSDVRARLLKIEKIFGAKLIYFAEKDTVPDPFNTYHDGRNVLIALLRIPPFKRIWGEGRAAIVKRLRDSLSCLAELNPTPDDRPFFQLFAWNGSQTVSFLIAPYLRFAGESEVLEGPFVAGFDLSNLEIQYTGAPNPAWAAIAALRHYCVENRINKFEILANADYPITNGDVSRREFSDFVLPLLANIHGYLNRGVRFCEVVPYEFTQDETLLIGSVRLKFEFVTIEV